MSVKLIAMGNRLMKDDGIGIEVALSIEEKLTEDGIDIIYGETDFDYCMSKVEENDFIILLDATSYGKKPGEIRVISLDSYIPDKLGYSQHCYSFFEVLKCYFPEVRGVIISIKIYEVDFNYGLSTVLQEKLSDLSKDILYIIEDVVNK